MPARQDDHRVPFGSNPTAPELYLYIEDRGAALSRRANRRRRDRRRFRDRTPPDPGPPDMTRALARWQGFLNTATPRGSHAPLFANLVVVPFSVSWDPQDDEPPVRARERALAEIVRRTHEQDR
jgi:hypothetical protein